MKQTKISFEEDNWYNCGYMLRILLLQIYKFYLLSFFEGTRISSDMIVCFFIAWSMRKTHADKLIVAYIYDVGKLFLNQSIIISE